AKDQRSTTPRRSHRRTDRSKPLRGGVLVGSAGFSGTFQNNRLARIDIVPDAVGHCAQTLVCGGENDSSMVGSNLWDDVGDELRRRCRLRAKETLGAGCGGAAGDYGGAGGGSFGAGGATRRGVAAGGVWVCGFGVGGGGEGRNGVSRGGSDAAVYGNC